MSGSNKTQVESVNFRQYFKITFRQNDNDSQGVGIKLPSNKEIT